MKNRKAFTLIELLVVIAIIGILATVSVIAVGNARTKARDAKRVGNSKQIQTALELYFNDNGRYPTEAEFNSGTIQANTPTGLVTYMLTIPSAPLPADGSCYNGSNQYSYTVSSDGSTYTISYCIGGKTGALHSGLKCLTRDGIMDAGCSTCATNCSGRCGGDDGCGGTCPNSCPGNYICTNDVCVDPDAFVGFTNCGDTGTYRGESYTTASMGSGCFMIKNLNVGTYIGYSPTVNGSDGIAGNADDCVEVSAEFWSCQGYDGIQKYCNGNSTSNCDTYGGLYEWSEMMKLPYHCNGTTYSCNGATCTSADYSDCNYPDPSATRRQGICPTGWHIPSWSEWSAFENSISSNSGLAKETGTAHWISPNTGATNSSEFTALPAGDRLGWIGDGYFSGLGYSASFWSSSPTGQFFYLRYNSTTIYHYTSSLNTGYSVRCILD